ncbi:MAG: MG2 domain-containing protein [Planctomycetota bacterium]
MPRLPLRRALGASALLVLLGALHVLGATSARAEDVSLLVETSPVPGDVLPVVVLTDAPGPVELTLVRLGSDAAAVSRGRIALTREQMTWLVDQPDPRHAPARSAQQAFLQLVNAEIVERTTVTATAAGQRVAAALRPRAPGVHVVAARFGPARALVPAVVSALGLVVKRHPEGVLVWCVDRRTGKPWSGVRVQREGDRETQVSDRDGFVRWSDVGPGPLALSAVAVERGEGSTWMHRAFGSGTWHPALPSGRRVHLTTHQPAYRPGDAVEVRGIVRVETPQGLARDAGARSVSVQLEDPAGTRHGEATSHLVEATGTFTATLRLPKDARTGAWRVVATIDGESHVGPLQVEAGGARPSRRASPCPRRPFDPSSVQGVVSAAWLAGGAVRVRPSRGRCCSHASHRTRSPTASSSACSSARNVGRTAPRPWRQAVGAWAPTAPWPSTSLYPPGSRTGSSPSWPRWRAQAACTSRDVPRPPCAPHPGGWPSARTASSTGPRTSRGWSWCSRAPKTPRAMGSWPS